MITFKKNSDKTPSSRYWFIGVHISSAMRKLEAALVGVNGPESGAELTLHKSVSFDLPEEISSVYQEVLAAVRSQEELNFANRRAKEETEEKEPFFLKSGTTVRSGKKASGTPYLSKLSLLRIMVASIQEDAIAELLSDAEFKHDDVVAVAVNGPEFWTQNADWEPEKTHFSVNNGKLLAERTGLNVVDSFIPEDWSLIDRGNPFLAFPYWLLLSSPERARLILDLGETARWTYIPSAQNAQSWQEVIHREVTPCGSLLNLMTQQVTKCETLVDVGGKLSVQGSRPAELLEHWHDVREKALGYKEISPQYYQNSCSGIFSETFYFDALKSSSRKFSSLDALCASVHWIAEEIKASVDRNAAALKEPYDLVLTGGAKQNGLLFTRLAALLTPTSVQKLSDFGLLEDSFDAVATAVLGILFAASVPAGRPEITGVARPELLGRLSPGTPDAWSRFLRFVGAGKKA